MSVEIQHVDALQLAARGGGLIAGLYGRPDLVVGIERSGTPVARAFAQGAGADCVQVRRQRAISAGWCGAVRGALRTMTPRAVRKVYKRLFFRSAVRVTRLLQGPEASEPARDHRSLESAIPPGCDFVVVVDDAIDSGRTMASVVSAVRNRNPRARVLAFALTSTAGQRIASQINVYADIVEFAEGDLSELSAETTDRHLSTLDIAPHPLHDRAGETRFLHLDMEAVYPNLLSDVFLALMSSASIKQRIELLAIRALCGLGARSRAQLEDSLDTKVGELPLRRKLEFQRALAKRSDRSCRRPLVEIARAPNVSCRLVAHRPRSYHRAIETASGLSIAADRDIRACENALHLVAKSGDFASVLPADTQVIPASDRTGLVTLLAATDWWSSPRRVAVRA